MSTHAYQLDIPDPESPSIWPWIIALVSGALLILLISKQTTIIPHSIHRQAQAVLASNRLNNANVFVDGRDLTLSGTIADSVNRDSLVDQLSSLPGARVVIDKLNVFDPAQKAKADQKKFETALRYIDTSAVVFEPGSAAFASGSEAPLENMVQLLRGYPDFRIRISGHTDNTGRPQINLRLSRERAQAVAQYLISSGVSSQQVIAQGYGATQPIADNASEQGRARNRRIEISYTN